MSDLAFNRSLNRSSPLVGLGDSIKSLVVVSLSSIVIELSSSVLSARPILQFVKLTVLGELYKSVVAPQIRADTVFVPLRHRSGEPWVSWERVIVPAVKFSSGCTKSTN
jgi:hypothetical protein